MKEELIRKKLLFEFQFVDCSTCLYGKTPNYYCSGCYKDKIKWEISEELASKIASNLEIWRL